MCGICGQVGRYTPEDSVRIMLKRLCHRGPENSGIYTDGHAELGHSRLSIVDLSPSGHQPMSNEDETVWLTANGEIYNSPELRSYLESRGHRFKSHSDNEVLLHLYEEEGPSFLPRINGMFALAIWDVSRRRLMLARDRLGIKPLYYYARQGCFLFASEIKALAALPGINTDVCPEGLRQYLVHQNTFGPTTLHNNIFMVEPGNYLLWEKEDIHSQEYWRPTITEQSSPPTFMDACSSYRDMATKAVRRHMMSDVEVAAYLSGGFDSTSVATLAAKDSTERLNTFTGTFERGGWYDEATGASAVAQTINSIHTEVLIGSDDLVKSMDNLIFALDEPRMGIGAFSQYMVARKAAERFKAILTGHGGDELFGGYPVFKLVHACRQLRTKPLQTLRYLVLASPAEWPHIAYFLSKRTNDRTATEYLPVLFPEQLLSKALHPDVYERLRSSAAPHKGLGRLLNKETDPYRRLCLTYLRAYLPGLFIVEDKISMAHALESRIPLCDNRLVETALSWPLDLKLHCGKLKAIPKEGMRPHLPALLYDLPKRGFPTPLAHWLRHDLKGWAEDRLLANGSHLHRLFRPEFLQRFVSSYLASWRGHIRPLDEIQTHRMWMLLSLEAWLRVSEERLGRRLELA